MAIEDIGSKLPASNFTAAIRIVFANGLRINENVNTYDNATNSSIGYVMDGVFTRVCNGIGTFKISIADPTWYRVEEAMIENKGKCTIAYGYIDKDGDQTPIMSAWMVNYELEYDIGRVIVKVSGMLTGFDLASVSNWSISTPGVKEVIKAIKEKFKLGNGREEPINEKAIATYSDLNNSNSSAIKIGNEQGETPIQVILQKLVRHATNVNNEGGFVFFLTYKDKDGNVGNTPCLNFCTPKYKETEDTKSTKAKVYRIFATRPDIRVLKYNPSWNANIIDIQGGSGIVNTQFNSVSGEIQLTQGTKDKGDLTAAPLVKNASNPGATGGATTIVQNAYALMMPLSADLLILGDPTYEILDRVVVDVRIPAREGNKYSNQPHKMSGSFLVVQVIDEINQGKFITQLKLMISPLVKDPGKSTQSKANEQITSGYPFAKSHK